MGNMSYCRFNNTSMDLDDCIEALENRDITSEEEKRNAKSMLTKFLEFSINEGLIDFENECIDKEEIERLISECEGD